MGVLWEISFWNFFYLTVLIGGGAAWMAGRALARSWRPFWRVAIYMLLLGAAVRFFHWGLFLGTPEEGSLFSLHYFLVDAAVLIIAAWLAYRTTRTTQMVTQYRWLYRRTSPFTWANR